MSHVLTAEEVGQYRDDGYVHVSSILSERELERFRDVTSRMIAFGSSMEVPHERWCYRTDPTTGAKYFYRINSAKVQTLEFQALMGHPGLLSVLETLIGPNFIPIDDSLVVKLPGAPVNFPWHRDTCPGLTRAGDFVAVAGIELDHSTVSNGCVHLVPGSHTLDDVNPAALTAEHGFHLPGAIPLETRPGDLLVHSANLLHGSEPNVDGALRRTVYLGALEIDEYIAKYQAPPELVRLQMRFMLRGIQLRQTLDYTEGEEPYQWKGNPHWAVDLAEDDLVEWDLTAHSPAA